MSADKDKADATSTAHSTRWLALPASLCGFLAAYYSWPLPDNNQAVVAATLTAVVILWVTEAIPLYISAITGSFLLLTLGDFSARAVFAPYFDPVIVLFLGGFILARGMQKYEIDHRMAHEILRRMGDSPAVFVLGLMLVTAFLSMWMSNTAAVAVLTPIAIAITEPLKHLGYRKAVIDFLYTRQGHVEKTAA